MDFNKDKYWKNRKKGERGQGDNKPKPVVLPNTDGNVEVGFDSHGRLIPKTRAWRRRHLKLRTKHLGVPPRKLADHKKKQATRKRRLARQLKKEKANG